MTTDPGDLVLDPTCGSGTTAYVAEQWGRRWITIDTSRVALALARARIMGARYPVLPPRRQPRGPAQGGRGHAHRAVDAPDPRRHPPGLRLRARAAHHAQVDRQQRRDRRHLGEVPGDARAAARAAERGARASSGRSGRSRARPTSSWPAEAKELHADWWEARIARQKEIDASIAAKAEFEYLYDKPYEDKKKVRVAGPFTVESLSPHRVLGVDENDELIDSVAEKRAGYDDEARTSPTMILENLKTAGVQQAHKEDRITFTSLVALARRPASAPRAATPKARATPARSGAPPSSSAPSSAPSRRPTSSPPPARPATPASTC